MESDPGAKSKNGPASPSQPPKLDFWLLSSKSRPTPAKKMSLITFQNGQKTVKNPILKAGTPVLGFTFWLIHHQMQKCLWLPLSGGPKWGSRPKVFWCTISPESLNLSAPVSARTAAQEQPKAWTVSSRLFYNAGLHPFMNDPEGHS